MTSAAARKPLSDAERAARQRWRAKHHLAVFSLPLPENATVGALIDAGWLRIEESTDPRAIRDALEACDCELLIYPKKSVTP